MEVTEMSEANDRRHADMSLVPGWGVTLLRLLFIILFVSLTLAAATSTLPDHSGLLEDEYDSIGKWQDQENLVDERYELLSLVWRLAGYSRFVSQNTDYQNKVATNYEEYRSHPVVYFASRLGFSYDAVFQFAVHIVKENERFVLLPNINGLINDGSNRWNQSNATRFIELLNDFYLKTHFSSFYDDHIPFYLRQTKRFIEQSTCEIEMAWFDNYSTASNLRIIYSPSSGSGNYGATVETERGDVNYIAMTSFDSYVIVHEISHSFANILARDWYHTNEEFRHWCDDSVDQNLNPQYSSGSVMSNEYVTRAYTILYYTEHGQELVPLLKAEKAQGFPYIEEVYAMITSHDIGGTDDSILIAPKYGSIRMSPEVSAYPLCDAAETELKISRLDPPRGMTPLGMINERFGFFIDKCTSEVLWLYDLVTWEQTTLIDYRGTGRTVACEIAFNEHWLIWLEITPYTQLADGTKIRDVQLKARPILLDEVGRPKVRSRADGTESAGDADGVVLGEGTNTPLESFYLPFDSLELAGDLLVTRHSAFHAGRRNTEVRLYDLSSGSLQVLKRCFYEDQEQILQCSISESLVTWDVQHLYSIYPKDLPDQRKASYSIEIVDLTQPEASGFVVRQVCQMSDFHAPVAYNKTLYALYSPSGAVDSLRNWIPTDQGNFSIEQFYSTGAGIPHFLGRGMAVSQYYSWNTWRIKTGIVTLLPGAGLGMELTTEAGYLSATLEDYFHRKIPHEIEFWGIFVGKRLLSWQSNTSDTHIVFDIRSDLFIELPTQISSNDLHIQALPGLDADYLIISSLTGDLAPYILRIE